MVAVCIVLACIDGIEARMSNAVAWWRPDDRSCRW